MQDSPLHSLGSVLANLPSGFGVLSTRLASAAGRPSTSLATVRAEASSGHVAARGVARTRGASAPARSVGLDLPQSQVRQLVAAGVLRSFSALCSWRFPSLAPPKVHMSNAPILAH